MARLAVVDTEPKETVKVHAMTAEQKEDEEDENVPWMSELGLDDHSAMSFTAGLLRPSNGGAWQYVVDRVNWTAGSFNRGSEIVVHCRRTVRKFLSIRQVILKLSADRKSLSKVKLLTSSWPSLMDVFVGQIFHLPLQLRKS